MLRKPSKSQLDQSGGEPQAGGAIKHPGNVVVDGEEVDFGFLLLSHDLEAACSNDARQQSRVHPPLVFQRRAVEHEHALLVHDWNAVEGERIALDVIEGTLSRRHQLPHSLGDLADGFAGADRERRNDLS